MIEEYDDPYYPQAKELLRDHDTVMVSRLQSTLRIGYNRAVQLMERAVRDGLASREDSRTGIMYRRAHNGGPDAG
jgi:DNA segregation ATPase FtsK/SpoIIIE-like protein